MPQTSIRVFQVSEGDAPLLNWLETLEKRHPKAYAKCLERILQLERLGNELRRPAGDFLRDGVYELRAKDGRVQYRILYFFCGTHDACLSHGITKEGAVPDKEIELALKRKEMVRGDLDRFTAAWGDE
jgi:phage-related protein